MGLFSRSKAVAHRLRTAVGAFRSDLLPFFADSAKAMRSRVLLVNVSQDASAVAARCAHRDFSDGWEDLLSSFTECD